MIDEHAAEKRRDRIALLERSRRRGYITLWETVAASIHSPLDLDQVDQILTEAGLQLEDDGSAASAWERVEEPDPQVEEEVEDAERDVEAPPHRIFEPTEYQPDSP